MDFEQLQVEYTKLQEQLNNTTNELNQFKENYNNLSSEKETLNNEISRLKNINYELFERVNAQYIKDTNQVEKENVSRETLQEQPTKTLEDITKELL